MEDRGVESGLEFVLDNKKLIIAFLVLISVCCFFFVYGFVLGKHQGFRDGTQSAAVSVPSTNSAGTPIKESPAAVALESNAPEKVARPEEQPLDWYKNVNQEKEEAKIKSPPPKKAKEPADISKSQVLPETPITYSVQIGAFRQKHEAELKAQSLKAKGFDYRIESPHPPEQLYLLKVGKFGARADANAMQLRLKKSGFVCFVKTN
jgi:cell division protein FtsN